MLRPELKPISSKRYNMDEVRRKLENIISSAVPTQVEDNPDLLDLLRLLHKTPDAMYIAVRFIAVKLHSSPEHEVLNALSLLDLLMKECGANFQAEVGKFRFLNELIKIVSPKYYASRTSPVVRDEVINLLYIWTKLYSHETKILEAYEMLKKQGVVSKDDSMPECDRSTRKTIYDDERNKLLRRLLHSKNPDDLDAANRLIKSMVKEVDRRVETDKHRREELDAIANCCKLINELLDTYERGTISHEEMDVLKDVYMNCHHQKTVISQIASELQENELLIETVNISEILAQVIDRYKASVTQDVFTDPGPDTACLVEVNPPDHGLLPQPPKSWLTNRYDRLDICEDTDSSDTTNKNLADTDALREIFESMGDERPPYSHGLQDPLPLQPVSVQLQIDDETNVQPQVPLFKVLSDLDILGETLLKENLPMSCKPRSSFQTKSTFKIPMNELAKSKESSIPKFSNSANTNPEVQERSVTLPFDINFLSASSGSEAAGETFCLSNLSPKPDTKANCSDETDKSEMSSASSTDKAIDDMTTAFSGLNMSVGDITPARTCPMTIFEDPNGLMVILNFTIDFPLPEVSVVVVTTINKSSKTVSEFLFQVVVPKECKVRLLPASSTVLPSMIPFMPPPAITQIMLIFNPTKAKVGLKYVVNCKFNGDPFTEIGEVKQIPI